MLIATDDTRSYYHWHAGHAGNFGWKVCQVNSFAALAGSLTSLEAAAGSGITRQAARLRAILCLIILMFRVVSLVQTFL